MSTQTTRKLKWTRDGDQHVAQGNGFEYRVTRFSAFHALSVKSASTGRTTDGGIYGTLERAKEVAYSLDIR